LNIATPNILKASRMPAVFAARLTAACLIVLTASALPALADNVVPNRPDFVAQPGVVEFTGKLIVRPHAAATFQSRGLTKDAAAAKLAQATARLAAFTVKSIIETGEIIVRVPEGKTDAAFANELFATTDYEYAEPDWLCLPATLPGDPGFALQYHHTLLHSDLAWSLGTGSPAVVVAIVDTGIDLTHPDLSPHLVPGYNVPDLLPEVLGGDLVDVVGHGTEVAGCAAAAGNNGQGVCGMGWNLSIMPIRASNLPSGGATLSDLTAGVRWAVDHGAKVVSVSYTGVQNSSVNTAGRYVKDRGGLLLWAAGNNRANWSSFDHADVLVVAATDAFDQAATFSSFGTAIDCAAPGVGIYTTQTGGTYGYDTGTSFSTPIVAGIAAMVFSINPTIGVEEAQNAVLLGCKDLGAPGEDNIFGRGRVDMFRTMHIAQFGKDAPIVAPDDLTITTGGSVIVDVLANDTDAFSRPIFISGVSAESNFDGAVEILSGIGPGGRDLLRYTPPALTFSIDDTFTYVASNGIAQREGTVTVRLRPRGLFRAADASPSTVPGLVASFYELEAPQVLPDFALMSPSFSNYWSNVNLLPTLNEVAGSPYTDSVGIVAEGYFNAPEQGLYKFYLTSDDGSRLIIGNQVIVTNSTLSLTTSSTGTTLLERGLHALRIEYFESEGFAALVAEVENTNLTRRPLQGILLARPGDPLDINNDGEVNPDDLADFIALYFSNELTADYDRDGQLTPDDLADYIGAFFSRP